MVTIVFYTFLAPFVSSLMYLVLDPSKVMRLVLLGFLPSLNVFLCFLFLWRSPLANRYSQQVIGYSYYTIFASAFLSDFLLGGRSAFFIATASCLMMTSGPMIGLRIVAGTVNLYLFCLSYIGAMLYQQINNPEYAEYCEMIPFPKGFHAGHFMLIFVLMVQVSCCRHVL